ncbi:DNA primase catalytic subunit PriS [Oxyplasma meridianum]|uniref:DNA primase small subunit PriS n=1 Tax=Oxyplasma meridianum TaxID=3073602 RepID=A0AAX4NHC5_9ARCH
METNPSDNLLKKYFREYYKCWKSPVPDLISSREIGFIPFYGSMIRHIRLINPNEVDSFVNRNVPRHFYYSTAYYRYPDEKKMDEKGWLGSELIFDLDADHIEGAEKMRYDEILDKVKEHTIRLIENFLLGTFGFDENDLKVFFSGGRGYHVHVLSESIYSLNSDGRREIADYIRGEGLASDELGKINVVDVKEAKGWISSIDQRFTEIYRKFSENDESVYEDRFLLKAFGNRENIQKYFGRMKTLKIRQKVVKKLDLMREPGREKYGYMTRDDQEILQNIITAMQKEETSEIDEPVTTDIHRLIRYPYSLHGKTGLIVCPVAINHIRDFDPLEEALNPLLKGKTSKINIKRNVNIKFNSELHTLVPGETELPLDISVFLAASRMGSFI